MEIKIRDQNFNYELKWVYDMEGDPVDSYTIFYLEKFKTTHKKYVFFGKDIIKYHPIILFQIPFHLDTAAKTTEEVTNEVLKAHDKWVDLNKRKEDIKNNKYIIQ